MERLKAKVEPLLTQVIVENLHPYRECWVHFFGHTGTDKGRAAGRDLLSPDVTLLLTQGLLWRGTTIAEDAQGTPTHSH